MLNGRLPSTSRGPQGPLPRSIHRDVRPGRARRWSTRSHPVPCPPHPAPSPAELAAGTLLAPTRPSAPSLAPRPAPSVGRPCPAQVFASGQGWAALPRRAWSQRGAPGSQRPLLVETPGGICWIKAAPGPRPHADAGVGASPRRSLRSHPFPAEQMPPAALLPSCPAAGGAEGHGRGSLQNHSPAPGWDEAASVAGQAARTGTGAACVPRATHQVPFPVPPTPPRRCPLPLTPPRAHEGDPTARRASPPSHSAGSYLEGPWGTPPPGVNGGVSTGSTGSRRGEAGRAGAPRPTG